MHTLDSETVVDGRFKIQGEPLSMTGQSISYQAQDLQAASLPHWRRRIFFKQYTDILPPQLGRLDLFYQNLGRRLGDKTSLFCIPVDRNINNHDLPKYAPACGVAGNMVYAAFPWISDVTLQEFLQRGLNEDEKLRITFALLNTLTRLARANVAHLDLKPANIMIQESRSQIFIRLIDMDLSRIDGMGLRSVGGTPGYMSPEHFSDKCGPVSCASDIFTLGILLSMILFQRHPFATMGEYEEVITQSKFHIPASDYHPQVTSAIEKCLSPDPADRITIHKLSNIFHQFHGTGLKKIRAGVMLVSGDYPRYYYETITFGYQELRGLDVPGIRHNKVFHLVVNPDQGLYSLTLLDENIDVILHNKKMVKNRSRHLKHSASLVINGVTFEIKLIPY